MKNEKQYCKGIIEMVLSNDSTLLGTSKNGVRSQTTSVNNLKTANSLSYINKESRYLIKHLLSFI